MTAKYEGKYKLGKYKGDCGVDVFIKASTPTVWLFNGCTYELNFKVKIAKNHLGLILPRSSSARDGINFICVPIDYGYTGNINLFYCGCDIEWDTSIPIGQLIEIKCKIPKNKSKIKRGKNKYGSSNKT